VENRLRNLVISSLLIAKAYNCYLLECQSLKLKSTLMNLDHPASMNDINEKERANQQ
jgi:hypothetical protein